MEKVYYTDDTMMTSDDFVEEEAENEEDDGDEGQLPGFRFYPTDEELVDFYLRRKVENKPFTLDLIKEIDIYEFDPWDLPKSSTVGDNEWYFFCKRGRKYRNSVRPNRVTGSGFWKATGIDKPIRSNVNIDIIVGLKKSLVFYKGNAGKGTKTEWMMHEFRLPGPQDFITHNTPPTITVSNDSTNATQLEAEVWTICRIFKRNVPSRKYTSNWREISTKRNHTSSSNSSEQACSGATNKSTINTDGHYISFSNKITNSKEPQPHLTHIQNPYYTSNITSHQHRDTTIPSSSYSLMQGNQITSVAPVTQLGQQGGASSSSYYQHELTVSPMNISSYKGQVDEKLARSDESWDELRHVWNMFQNQ